VIVTRFPLVKSEAIVKFTLVNDLIRDSRFRYLIDFFLDSEGSVIVFSSKPIPCEENKCSVLHASPVEIMDGDYDGGLFISRY
jgi:hypothetical protein